LVEQDVIGVLVNHRIMVEPLIQGPRVEAKRISGAAGEADRKVDQLNAERYTQEVDRLPQDGDIGLLRSVELVEIDLGVLQLLLNSLPFDAVGDLLVCKPEDEELDSEGDIADENDEIQQDVPLVA
jgi:hypothetical protein